MMINYFCTREFIQTASSFMYFLITLTLWQDITKAAELLKFAASLYKFTQVSVSNSF